LITTLLLADDDPDDRMLFRDALEEARWAVHLREVEDGGELLDYLQRRGKYADPADSPRPGVILLDLKMPGLGGLQALEVIKLTEGLCRIPIVVLTTSSAEEDITGAYDLGANSYVVKPSSFSTLVEIMQSLEKYWLGVVTLPPTDAERP
jgi:CheY-like chemotaxis protein